MSNTHVPWKKLGISGTHNFKVVSNFQILLENIYKLTTDAEQLERGKIFSLQKIL